MFERLQIKVVLLLFLPFLLIGTVVFFSSFTLPGQVRIHAYSLDRASTKQDIQGVVIYLNGVDTSQKTGANGQEDVLVSPLPASHDMQFYHADYVTVTKTGIQVPALGSVNVDVEMVPVSTGDINADGQVNAGDVLLLSQFIVGKKTPTVDQFKRANMTPAAPAPADSQLNAGDLLYLIKLQ